MPSIELVVARYQESLAWLNNIPRSLQVHILNKDDSGKADPELPHHLQTTPRLQTLPNCGRESHSYLTHIVENYQNLADLSVFAQGHPFDHCADFHTILRDLERRKMPPETFHWLGFILDWDDPKGHRLFRAWSKNPEQEELDLSGFFQKLFHQDCPPRLTFFPRRPVYRHRDVIHRRSLEFYRQALELSLRFPQAAHCFERCWDRVFQVNGIPEALRELPCPTTSNPSNAYKIPLPDFFEKFPAQTLAHPC
ncbi:MAG: DUF3431 domain-containing protein [Blastochloris sp.]|nr:DUF3431 domain-containing protein [Blastochloris sp.]